MPDQNSESNDPLPDDLSESRYRAPRNFSEHFIANFRLQPAIPAVIVFLASTIFPVMFMGPQAVGESTSLWLLLIPAGILISCGLAIAAGFCSLFPQIVWILLAWWGTGFTRGSLLPAYNQYVLFIGMVAAGLMVVLQIWRVSKGKFSPTVRDDRQGI